MKRLLLAAATTAVLATAILFLRPATNLPHTQAPRNTEQTQAKTASPDDSRPGKHRSTSSPQASDPFQKRALQLAAMPPDTPRENAVRDLAQEWAKDSPLAAEQWAQALQDPAERERALTHDCFEVAPQDPREAIRIAQGHKLHPATLDALTGIWASADFAAASSWADTLPPGEPRDRLLMRLVQSRASTSPAEAAALLSESPLTGTMQDEAAMAVLHQWLLKDPEAARQWVELFPHGPLKERATIEVKSMTAHR